MVPWRRLGMSARYQLSGIRHQERRRMGKRGQVFSGILVLITLLMCGISVVIYLNQQDNVQSSLVSPLAVLEVRDSLTIFEIREKELILESLNKVEAEFGSEEFLEEFREEFILSISDNDKMKDFIFSNLTWKGDVLNRGSFNEDAFLGNVVYDRRLSRIDSSEMVFGRGKIGKSFELRVLNNEDVNFPVDVEFEFEKEYLINRRGGSFSVKIR